MICTHMNAIKTAPLIVTGKGDEFSDMYKCRREGTWALVKAGKVHLC